MVKHWLLAWLCLLVGIGECLRSSMTYHPQGASPLLYTPGAEPIMHLDQVTFDDTIFDQTKTNSFVVEFYADWCGHCRSFSPYYREFAALVNGWNEISKVAAINCADSFNSAICRNNGVVYFPMLKYFPRLSTAYSDGQLLEPTHSAINLRDQLSTKIVNEYNHLRYLDWPNLHYIDVNTQTRFEDLWQGIPPDAQYMAIVFEQYDNVASQIILNMWQFRSFVGVRRVPANSPLSAMLSIQTFPYVAVFQRGDQQALYMSAYGPNTMQEVLNQIHSGQRITRPSIPLTPTTLSTRRTINCEKQPDRCVPMYFVSETDMLKAMRSALLDEVIRSNEYVEGANFTNLYNFVSLLADHFPTVSLANDVQRRSAKQSTISTMRRSENAKAMFAQMRRELDTKPRIIAIKEWKTTFEAMERTYNNPFPVDADWQHCKGSSPQYRGYTCGLWTTFHTLTIHTYMNTMKSPENNKKVNPLQPLKAIQGWVNSFFGCQDCKGHFMRMTTEKFPMTAQRVRHPHDMFMYLWRAHNIVNNRLHGDVTEDPQFLKYQFPPFFLCPTCHSGGQFSRRKVRNFLLRYYANIRPYHWVHNH
ncbi:Sulfhydryl oxidase [Aphelenchoides besseyi]|nr:Sulfhydryl oxidase [Aphelenchoides besseyi]KAI6202250.1 Sulfhydryl oxidase [Aphelenchoides besseyi]